MPHQILKGLWIHSRLCHFTAISMPADMRRHKWYLYHVDTIVFIADVLEIMIPMKRIYNASILIKIQKSRFAIYHRLRLWWSSVCYYCLKTLFHLGSHRNLPTTTFSLRLFNIIPYMSTFLKLMININRMILKVYI